MKRPAFQFYPADWRKDTALQFCSLAAQGLWINALCIAHECEPYGHLALNGKPMNSAQIGRLVGISGKECDKLLAELIDAGVCSKADDGAVYSRRMVRDEDLRNRRATGGAAGAEHGAKGASFGAQGGRPRKEQGGIENPPSDETRGVSEPPSKPPPSSSSSSSASAERQEANASSSAGPTGKTPTIPCPYDRIVALYHEVLPGLPSVRLMNPARQKALRKVWAWVLTSTKPDGSRRAMDADGALLWFRAYFERASQNDFLMGRSGRTAEHANWKPDLEFLLTDRGMTHVIERTAEAA